MFNNIVGTSFVKVISLMLNIYSVNAYLNFFNDDVTVYGIWLTVISVFNWVLMFDLGVGNGLRNNLTVAIANNDKIEQKRLISSAYILLSVLGLIIIILSFFAFEYISWGTIFNIDNNYITNETISYVVWITFFGILCHFVLKLFVSILYAFKYNTFASISLLSTNLIMVLYASLISNSTPDFAIIEIAKVYTFALIVPIFLISIILFNTKFSEIKPSYKYYSNNLAVKVLALGGKFFLIQVFLLIINSTNEILIINIDGPQSVVLYNVYFRIFTAIIAFGSVINNPIWSSISASYAINDFRGVLWRKKTVDRIAIALSIISLFIAILYKPIAGLLFDIELSTVSTSHAILFAIYTSISLFINSTSTVSNGINELTPQIIGTFLAAVLKLPVLYFVYNVIPNWTALVITNILILSISLIIQYFGLSKRIAKEMNTIT